VVILETGLLNYDWEGSRLIVQVLMKLVDPQTGQVIGRARKGAGRKVGPVEKVLADGVGPLKDIFADMTRPLVAAALQDLGLIRAQKVATASPGRDRDLAPALLNVRANAMRLRGWGYHKPTVKMLQTPLAPLDEPVEVIALGIAPEEGRRQCGRGEPLA